MIKAFTSIFIKSVILVDPESEFHMKAVNIAVQDGLIKAIGVNLNPDDTAEILDGDGAFVSSGWCDIGAHCGEPGDEVHETVNSLCRTAMAGGYNHVAVFSNHIRPYDNRHIISDIIARSVHGVNLIPIPSVTKNLDGIELSEMLDLATVSPALFTDGFDRQYDNAMLCRALEYANQCQGVILTIPGAKRSMKKGLVNESKVSAQMGIPGMPGYEEVAALAGELSLVSYAGSPVFVHLLSHRESIGQITFRREQGLQVTTSVSAMHLLHTESDVEDFDENFKLLPPLRSEADRLALIEGLKAGHIDMVVSNHQPISSEQKEMEFGESPFGAIGLETAFYGLVTAIADVTAEQIHHWLSLKARKTLGLQERTLAEGAVADLTIFSLEATSIYQRSQSKSLSRNTPYTSQRFKGRIVGSISKNRLYLAD
jgi:dihydroorotase